MEKVNAKSYASSVEIQPINPTDDIEKQVLEELYKRNIQSVLVEGGAYVLNQFIGKDLWDEARVFTANKVLSDGLKAPCISGDLLEKNSLPDFELKVFRNRK